MSYMERGWHDIENDKYNLREYEESGESCPCENRISVNGRGSIRVTPDTAVITMGIEMEGMDLNALQRENAEISQRVIRILVRMGIDEKDIETASYVVEPLYEYVEGRQIFKGYRVKNLLRVTVRELDSAGRIVDTAMKNGFNTVNSIDFDISDHSGYYYQALKLAVEDAVRKAEVISRTMGVNFTRIPVSVTEESYGPIPMVLGAFSDSKIAVTPIRPKKIEVAATVKAVFKYDNDSHIV